MPLVAGAAVTVRTGHTNDCRITHRGCSQISECVVVSPQALATSDAEASSLLVPPVAVAFRSRPPLPAQRPVPLDVKAELHTRRVHIERCKSGGREVLRFVDLDEGAAGRVDEVAGQPISPARREAIEIAAERDKRSEERRVGKECRSRWSP